MIKRENCKEFFLHNILYFNKKTLPLGKRCWGERSLYACDSPWCILWQVWRGRWGTRCCWSEVSAVVEWSASVSPPGASSRTTMSWWDTIEMCLTTLYHLLGRYCILLSAFSWQNDYDLLRNWTQYLSRTINNTKHSIWEYADGRSFL